MHKKRQVVKFRQAGQRQKFSTVREDGSPGRWGVWVLGLGRGLCCPSGLTLRGSSEEEADLPVFPLFASQAAICTQTC